MCQWTCKEMNSFSESNIEKKKKIIREEKRSAEKIYFVLLFETYLFCPNTDQPNFLVHYFCKHE